MTFIKQLKNNYYFVFLGWDWMWLENGLLFWGASGSGFKSRRPDQLNQ